jgi:hypothetical protein
VKVGAQRSKREGKMLVKNCDTKYAQRETKQRIHSFVVGHMNPSRSTTKSNTQFHQRWRHNLTDLVGAALLLVVAHVELVLGLLLDVVELLMHTVHNAALLVVALRVVGRTPRRAQP